MLARAMIPLKDGYICLPAASAGRALVRTQQGNESMTLCEYAPLGSSGDRIRTGRFFKLSPSGKTTLQCTSQHISPVAIRHMYKKSFDTSKEKKLPARQSPERELSSFVIGKNATHDWEKDGVKPMKIDA